MYTAAARIISHTGTKKARFIFDEPESWTFDGENGGAHSDISFENCPQAIALIY